MKNEKGSGMFSCQDRTALVATVTERNPSSPLLNALQPAMPWVMKRTPLLYLYIMFGAERRAIIGV
jgi:hypothetical protein